MRGIDAPLTAFNLDGRAERDTAPPVGTSIRQNDSPYVGQLKHAQYRNAGFFFVIGFCRWWSGPGVMQAQFIGHDAQGQAGQCKETAPVKVSKPYLHVRASDAPSISTEDR